MPAIVTEYQALTQIFQDSRATNLEPIAAPQLDARDEKAVVEQAIAIAAAASQGQLSDFTPGSPTRALVEAMAHVYAKTSYVANQVAGAAAVNWLQIAGIQRIVGRAATTSLEFRLSAALATPFFIPQGFIVRAGRIQFRTVAPLTIAPGQVIGQVSAACTQTGSIGNVRAGEIKNPIQPLAFLGSVRNPLAVTNGEDAETDAQVIARGFSSLRRRNLITQDDYEEFTRAAMGQDTVCRAYGKLDETGRALDVPSVTVGVCKSTGELLTQGDKDALLSALNLKGHITVEHRIADIIPVRLDLTAIVGVANGEPAGEVADKIALRLAEYLSPGERWIETQMTANDLEFQVRSSDPRIDAVDIIYFDEPGRPLQLDSIFTSRFQTLQYNSLTLTVLQAGQSYLYGYGQGDPD
jgi:hypothetical protein